MLWLRIDSEVHGETDDACVGDVVDALEMLHYVTRDLGHPSMAMKILDIADELNARQRTRICGTVPKERL